MKNFKSKLMMPLMVMAFAIAGAFVTNASASEDVFAPETGYIQNNIPCDTPVQCDNTPSAQICTAEINGEEIQAFGKISPTSTTCSKVLYRLM